MAVVAVRAEHMYLGVMEIDYTALCKDSESTISGGAYGACLRVRDQQGCCRDACESL